MVVAKEKNVKQTTKEEHIVDLPLFPLPLCSMGF
jgi:hypothetical protein